LHMLTEFRLTQLSYSEWEVQVWQYPPITENDILFYTVL
jgi:hypothetical protein